MNNFIKRSICCTDFDQLTCDATEMLVQSFSFSIATLTSEMTRAPLQLTDHEQNDEWNGATLASTQWPYRELFTLSRSWYLFTDPRRMESLVSLGHE